MFSTINNTNRFRQWTFILLCSTKLCPCSRWATILPVTRDCFHFIGLFPGTDYTFFIAIQLGNEFNDARMQLPGCRTDQRVARREIGFAVEASAFLLLIYCCCCHFLLVLNWLMLDFLLVGLHFSSKTTLVEILGTVLARVHATVTDGIYQWLRLKNLILNLRTSDPRNRPDGAPTHSRDLVTVRRNAGWKVEGRVLMRRRVRQATLWLNVLSEVELWRKKHCKHVIDSVINQGVCVSVCPLCLSV